MRGKFIAAAVGSGPTQARVAAAEHIGFPSDTSGGITAQSLPGQTGRVVIGSVAAVPLPAAFPLFASGLGALGLLGWRRKRKATALAASFMHHAIALIFLCFSVSAANAVTTLVPTSATIATGDTFNLEVRVSGDTGWTDWMSDLEIKLKYDRTILNPVSASFGSYFTTNFSSASWSTFAGSDPNDVIDLDVSGGHVTRTNWSDELFATITFQGIAPGFTNIGYFGGGQGGCCNSPTFFDDSLAAPAEVTVTETSVVPLPAALPLFATGLGALGLLGWRRKRKVQATA